jgi:hypothetical protein
MWLQIVLLVLLATNRDSQFPSMVCRADSPISVVGNQ